MTASPSFLWDLSDLEDQHGRTAVVTGATSGLGLVVARELARRGAHVVVAARDPAKAARVLPAIALADAAGTVEVRRLDTASLESIVAFVAGLERDDVRLDVLVNNAGVSVPTFELGPDGLERTYATNVVGPAVLAERLLPRLVGPAPRVVLVGSNLSQRSRRVPDLDAVDDPARYHQLRAYTSSKVAAAAAAADLADRLRAAGSPVRSVIAHPGIAATAMSQQGGNPAARVGAVVAGLLARPVEDGARPILWAATAAEVEEQTFVGPRLSRRDRRLHPAPVRGAAADPGFRRRVRAFVAERGGLPLQESVR